MSQRITPLTRNQLLELEALMRSLITVVTQQQKHHYHHHHAASSPHASTDDQSWPSSALSTPTSLTATAAKPPSSSLPGGISETSAFAGFSSPRSMADAESGDSPSAYARHGTHAGAPRLIDHAVLHGTFIDVFTDPLTANSWRLYDKILYIVWWSHRLPSCTNCGMQDAWMPSGDVEFKCAFCIAGAGTTRSNAVVEDHAAANNDVEYGNDSGDDDDVDENDKANGGGGGEGAGGQGGGPIDTYLFFYEWLRRIPVLGPAGAASAGQHPNGGVGMCGHDAGNSQRLSAASKAGNTVAPSPVHYSRGGGRPAQASPAASATTTNACSSVMLPSGESLPAVLRAAYDVSCLLTAPGLPCGTTSVIRAAGLYMSLLLHRYVSLFPLFCDAGRVSSTGGVDAAASAPPSRRACTPLESPEVQPAEVGLQWIDVELVCALLGVAAPSFFESPEVSVQHLQNVFTVAAAYGVPSVLWHPGRAPGRVEVMKTLKDKVIQLCPLHSTTAGVSGLCPEHTAMVVALELARRVDAHPVAAASTSPAAAAQNAQRIGTWLDVLGLYPTRRVYRDAHSYYQVVRQEEEDNGTRDSRHNSSQDDNAVGKGRSNDTTMQAWEKTLTELAAVKDPQLIAAAERHGHHHDALAATLDASNNTKAGSAYLVTERSPFYKRFEWILTSPCANALLHVFAAVFRLTPMELADMALRSGIYQGHASGFVQTLSTAVQRGAFDVMPLARRLSPVTSSWMSAYMALHSGDRLPLLAALFQLNSGQNAARDRQAALTRLLQKILRKHQAAQLYQLNYVLRVTDEDERHFNGIYFLSNVMWEEGLAVFTCLRSGRKTITLNRFAHTLSLCYMNAKEKIVSRLSMHVVSPVVAAVETDAARLVMEMALGTVARGVSTHGDPWGAVVRCLDKCGRVRRRMRVPMLASRLDALASIRENTNTTARCFQQFSSLYGVAGGDGGGGTIMTTMMMGPTLLGWGETEALLAAAPQLDVRKLRRDLQWNFLALPNASLLSGLSENRVVAMYASLVGILELIDDRLSAGSSSASPAALLNNWVEELLFVDETEEEGPAAHDLVDDFSGPSSFATHRSAPGWSPPLYRNSRGGTPKQSRSPKSKFVSVSASTNTGCSNAPTSAFTTTYANTSSRYMPTPPQTFARPPYTMTPPSMAPSRSPVLRAAAPNATVSTPSLFSARVPQENWKSSNNVSPSAFASSSSSSHNAVSTPISRFQLLPSASSLGANGSGPSRTTPPPLHTSSEAKRASCGEHNDSRHPRNPNTDALHGEGSNAQSPGALPDLELSASTADVERQVTSRAKPSPPQQRSQRRACRRRRERNDDDDNDDDRSDGDEGKDRAVGPQRQQQEQALRLLQQMLPPYWEVLLGLAVDIAPPSPADDAAVSPTTAARSRVRGDAFDDDDDDEGESGGRRGAAGDDARRIAAHARERRWRKQQQHAVSQHCGGSYGDVKARASAASARHNERGDRKGGAVVLPSASSVRHRPFNFFDAEECRRRLHRLYVFIGKYIQCKQRCQEQAAAGTLPAFPEKTASPPLTAGTPCRPEATTTAVGSPPTHTRAAGSGTMARSPPGSLTPPPPYHPPAAPQCSPPHHQRSPPPSATPTQRSPRGGHTQRSPPHDPLPRSSSVSGAQRLPRQSGGATSPVSLSPSLTAASCKNGAEGGSPRQTSSATPPIRATPPQHNKRTSGTMKSQSDGHGQRARRGHERTAVALVDDENFSLPPPEIVLAHHQQQQSSRAERTSGGGAAEHSHHSGKNDWPSSSAAAVQEGQRPRPQRQEAATLTASSDTDAEEATLKAPVPSRQTSASRKRVRDVSDSDADEEVRNVVHGNVGLDRKYGAHGTDQSSEGGDAQEEEQQSPQQPQLLRRKAKKLGRRRRRQEQSTQHHQHQQQQSVTKASLHSHSSRSNSNSNSKESSRSPEIRAWRNGKVSGSVSPLGNSPALLPRPTNVDPSARSKPRTSNPSSPTQNAVPSIRGRTARAAEEADTSSSFSTASDSGRSADYDTDAN